MSNVAIIPARGGSKRIPGKNIKSFCGKPVIAYSIEAALKSNLFDEVMVSTDDEEIAAVAKQYGAKIPFMRSAKNSDDHATIFDVIEEVATFYNQQNISFTYAACIYATAPFVTEELLEQAYNELQKKYDSVIPIVKYSYNIWRSLRLKNEKVEMQWSENINKRSQDLSDSYHDAGMFLWCDIEKVLNKKKVWTDNTGAIIIDEFLAQDIDTMHDWKLAELKYTYLHSESFNA